MVQQVQASRWPMVLAISRRDWLEWWRDGRLQVGLAVFMLLLITAFVTHWQRQQALTGERLAAASQDYAEWGKQEARHPHDAAHQGLHVFKPEAPLGLLDPGITAYVGNTQWLQAHRQSEVRFRPVMDATGLQRFGDLSVGWLVQVMGPLLIIMLGFSSVAGERDQGTLRQTLAQGVAPSVLLTGKALALGAVALTMMAMVTVLGLMGLAGSLVMESAAQVNGVDVLIRLALWVVAHLVYLAIVVALTLLVSVWARSARVAVIVLLAAWIASVTVLPRLASDVARSVLPTPTRDGFQRELDTALDSAYKQAWKAQLGTDKRWGGDLPLSQWGRALQVDDQAGYAVLDARFGSLWDRFEAQQKLQTWAGFLAPLLALRSTSSALVGTDFVAHRSFSKAAEQHRRLMQDQISEDLIRHADTRGQGHFTYKADENLWKKLPAFKYEPPTLKAYQTIVLQGLVVLIVVLCVAVGGLLRSAANRLKL
jgi:ABC-2 type transport system permease protein